MLHGGSVNPLPQPDPTLDLLFPYRSHFDEREGSVGVHSAHLAYLGAGDNVFLNVREGMTERATEGMNQEVDVVHQSTHIQRAALHAASCGW